MMGVGVGVADGVAVGVGMSVAVGVTIDEAVGAAVGVVVGVGVGEVAVGVAVAVSTGVTVGVGVGPAWAIADKTVIAGTSASTADRKMRMKTSFIESAEHPTSSKPRATSAARRMTQAPPRRWIRGG
jgi:hypothetical protein